MPTTSSAPRYALSGGFAVLFDPAVTGDALAAAITAWQETNLSAGARARIQLVRRGAVASREGIVVAFPNGETRRLSAGPSSLITKAVIEEFGRRFLGNAGVIFLSESGNRVIARDEQLANDIGLRILPERLLPDIVLVDLAPKEPLLASSSRWWRRAGRYHRIARRRCSNSPRTPALAMIKSHSFQPTSIAAKRHSGPPRRNSRGARSPGLRRNRTRSFSCTTARVLAAGD